MVKAKSPQEKKSLSLERDRRNVFGENAKSSRKNIPRSKQLSHQAARRAANSALETVKGIVPEDAAIAAELKSRIDFMEKQRNSFVKRPDMPLGKLLVSKASRKLQREIQIKKPA